MKPGSYDIPARDLGRPRIRLFGEALLRRLESLEARLKEPGQPPPMLSAERALLKDLDQQASDGVTLERQRVRDRALDEEYFRREIKAGCVAYEGTVTETMNSVVVMRFPAAGAGTNAHAQLVTEGRVLWAKTRPRITVWYTSPVGSTSTFNLRFVVRVCPENALVSSGLLFAADFSVAGPAVANTLLKATYRGTADIPALSQVPIQIRIGRMGGDANANSLDIILAVVAFEEVA